jgi:CheY-like chemotaxis protein
MKKLKCVLLIDDNKATNFLHETLFEELDVSERIVIAYNGKDGLAHLDRVAGGDDYPELILVDIHMPVMDGFDFLEGYRQRQYHEKYDSLVVMLTTSTNPRDVDRILAAGFAEYLPKPLAEENILELVRKYQSRSNSSAIHKNAS